MTGALQTPRWIPGAFPSPAVAADLAIKPTGMGGILIKSVRFTFTADATVGNRSVRLVATDGTVQWWEQDLPALIAAGGVVNVSAWDGAIPNVSASGLVSIPLPRNGLWLPQGNSLATVTTFVGPADAYSGLAGLVYELPSGPYVRMEPTTLVYIEGQE